MMYVAVVVPGWGTSCLEDVKKLISLIFRDFIFDPKCLPTAQRSLIRHPRAIFLAPSSLQILKSIFSHLPVTLLSCHLAASESVLMDFVRISAMSARFVE
jgi:hypothetical protein